MKYKIMTETNSFLSFYIVMICVTWYNKYSGKIDRNWKCQAYSV